MITIKRGFADIAEGQMHFRRSGGGAKRPFVMLHGSPESSAALVRVIRAMAATRPVIAFDTLGQGDSAPPAVADPEMGYFADAVIRALDGLGVTNYDLYGFHTGARIATEIGIAVPRRVGKIILDGMSDGVNEMYREYVHTLDNSHLVDQEGSQFIKTFNKTRDSYLFWPPYRRDVAHWRGLGLPHAQVLHDRVMDTLKAVRFGHKAYQAAILYPSEKRLPLLRVPTMATCAPKDTPWAYLEGVARLTKNSVKKPYPFERPMGQASDEEITALARMFDDFLG